MREEKRAEKLQCKARLKELRNKIKQVDLQLEGSMYKQKRRFAYQRRMIIKSAELKDWYAKQVALEEVCKIKGHEVPKNIDEIRDIFHNHPVEKKTIPSKNMANEKELRRFLQEERGFSDARLKRALDRLKSAGRLRDPGQASIFDF